MDCLLQFTIFDVSLCSQKKRKRYDRYTKCWTTGGKCWPFYEILDPLYTYMAKPVLGTNCVIHVSLIWYHKVRGQNGLMYSSHPKRVYLLCFFITTDNDNLPSIMKYSSLVDDIFMIKQFNIKRTTKHSLTGLQFS